MSNKLRALKITIHGQFIHFVMVRHHIWSGSVLVVISVHNTVKELKSMSTTTQHMTTNQPNSHDCVN